MVRGIWAALVMGAAGAGCGGPQYYTAPPEHLPPPANVGGVAVEIVDQRPEWEKKPFTGVVCLYHLGKAHPDGWVQLAEETSGVVAALPQKPERVEVVVSSFQLVRSGDTVPRFRDFSAGPNPNPAVQSQPPGRDSGMPQGGNSPVGSSPRPAGDGPPNKVEMAFASKDDPRRMLADHPAGASCSIQARIRLVFPGGREQAVDVKTIFRAPNDSGTDYWGQAMDNAARGAVIDFGRQFRAGVGLTVN